MEMANEMKYSKRGEGNMYEENKRNNRRTVYMTTECLLKKRKSLGKGKS